MAVAHDKNSAARVLVDFIRSYTEVMEHQLSAIRETSREAVDQIMQGINEISQKTATSKQKASEVLETTYTNPDTATKNAMDSVQDEVAAIFDAASKGEAPPQAKKVSTAAPVSESDPKLRNAGFFSKHMEALHNLDEQLQNELMTMMGSLSRDDVIAQRIEHVQQSLHALQAGLSYILVDFDGRCKASDVDRFVQELKDFTMKCYTMEEEKKVFRKTFGDLKKAS